MRDLGEFEVALLGTNLTNCQLALEGAKAGKRILHTEPSPYYGGWCGASIKLAKESIDLVIRGKLQGRVFSTNLPENVIVDLNPFLIYYEGPISNKLVEESLAAYVEFVPIPQHGILTDAMKTLAIPRSKEEVMLSDDLSLLEKRQIMKLQSALQHWTVDWKGLLEGCSKTVRDTLLYGIGCSLGSNEASSHAAGADDFLVPTHFERYMKSVRRSGGSFALLYPYGGTSTINQAYCRAAAIKGAVHILSQHAIQRQQQKEQKTKLFGDYEGQPWDAMAEQVLDESVDQTTISLRRAICILQARQGIFGSSQCGHWVVPPRTLANQNASIFILQLDQSSGCCSADHLIVYFWSASKWNDEDLFISLVSHFISLPGHKGDTELPSALFVAFYVAAGSGSPL